MAKKTVKKQNKRLTAEAIKRIKALRNEGKTYAAIANAVGCSLMSVVKYAKQNVAAPAVQPSDSGESSDMTRWVAFGLQRGYLQLNGSTVELKV